MSARLDFCIPQGTDYWLPMQLVDGGMEKIDLAGYSAAMQVRTTTSSVKAIDTLSTANGRITIDAEKGEISLVFPNAMTSVYPAGRLVYDLEIKSADGFVYRLIEGKITVTREVTRVNDF